MTTESPSSTNGDNSTVSDVIPTTTASSVKLTSDTTIKTTTIMPKLNSAQVFGLSAGIAIVLIAILIVLICLRKRGKLKSLHCFGKPIRSRRSSNSSSRHPLDLETYDDHDNDSLNDDNLRPTDGDLFAIGDVEDVEYPTNTAEDGYFYDEVFSRSAFEDAATNQSIKQLYSIQSDDELPVLPNSRH
ncbi:uncharacterized protein LOC121388107 [Gigantopelta aegis]|uniref:uncharacterized protein LOC121388107 n=1 Tax=Gigantopelta aegis TaxID=1735272 RepID=UPI001B88D133|nr:uncharacterized protein LOC121388107 [Gigantopelta aegis]XP_041375380.1 uncharacterized protein LOC121388107 [Gigantopelta aegis]